LDPTQENDLDSLIARIDDDPEDAESAAPDDSDDDLQETVTDEVPAPADLDGVDEVEFEEADGSAPDDDGEVEVNPADLTPVSVAQPTVSADAAIQARLAAAEQALGEHTAFKQRLDEERQKLETERFLESLKGMDPEDRNRVLAEHAAREAIRLHGELEGYKQAQARAQFEANEANLKAQAIAFIKAGGRRSADGRLLVNESRKLTDAEARRLAYISTAQDMERYADDCIADRKSRTAAAREAKRQQAIASGVTATTSGVSNVASPEKAPTSLDELVDGIFAAA
jgi:hypothetical protein